MSKKGIITFSELAQEAALQPLEQVARMKKNAEHLFIGIPREITSQENRVPLTPSAVASLVNNGHEVWIESKAGDASHFYNNEYSEAGAKIINSHEEIYKADIVIKIEPPTAEEIEYMRPDQILISALQLEQLDPILLNRILLKRINAIAFEFLQDDSGALPFMRTMSEIAGHACIMLASECLNNAHGGKGELLGGFTGIPPTHVVIIGAGAVGEYAARAAIGLGACVKVFDNELYRLRRLQENLGTKVYTSTIQPKILSEALRTCDIAIGALRGEKGRTPVVVSEQMVSKMKPKSVIVDISIDQGGVFETSEVTNHKNPIIIRHDVIHYCVPNITSRVSRTTSYALSNICTPLLMDMANSGGFYEYMKEAAGSRQGIYAFKGSLCNASLAYKFGMKSKDIDFLLGAFS
ncbi:MAG: alanine dehydrogenase [Bacteroidia bacterium]|nr:alanine dehydrogenase [Bacteroidia bacterium]